MLIFTKRGYRFRVLHGAEGNYLQLDCDGFWRVCWTDTAGQIEVRPPEFC